MFFSAAYTEGLFLLTLVGAVYHFARRAVAGGGAGDSLCGLTRPNGAFLSVVLGLMALEIFLREWRRRSPRPMRPPPFRWGAHLRSAGRGVGAGPRHARLLGVHLFLTGNPFQWTMQNVAWGRVYRGLDSLVTDRVDFIANNGVYAYASTQTIDLFYLVSVLFVLGAVWPVYRRFGLPYAVLLLINLLPPMAAGGLLSMGRVTSVLFPVFLWLGAAVPPRHRVAWIGCLRLPAGIRGGDVLHLAAALLTRPGWDGFHHVKCSKEVTSRDTSRRADHGILTGNSP